MKKTTLILVSTIVTLCAGQVFACGSNANTPTLGGNTVNQPAVVASAINGTSNVMKQSRPAPTPSKTAVP